MSFLFKKKRTRSHLDRSERGNDTDDSDGSTSKELLALKDPLKWSTTDVAAWLELIELPEYKATFIDQSITGEVLSTLTDDDLKSLGIQKLGHRRRILREISALNGETIAQSISSSTSVRSASETRGERRRATSTTSSGVLDASNSESDIGAPHGHSEKIYVKLYYKNDVHALRLPPTATLRQLRAEIKKIYDTPMRIKYKDEEDELITLRHETELAQLLKDMLIENKRSLRLYLTPKAKSTREQKDKKRSTIKAEWAAFDSVLDCVIVTDEAGIVCYLNAAGEALTGWKASEIVGQTVNVLMSDEYRNYHDGYIQAYLRTRQPRVMGTGRNVVLMKKDSSLIIIRLELTEKIIENKTFFIAVMKKADENSRKSLLAIEREVLDNLVVPAIIIDERGIIMGFNNAATKFLGYSLVDVANKNITICMTSPDKERHDEYLRRYLETGQAKILNTGRKVVVLAKNGELKPAYLSVTEKKDTETGKRLFTGILQDLSIQ